MISIIRAPAFIAIALVAALSASSCGTEGTEPPDDDAMHITLPDADLTLTIGTSGTVRVIIVRNGFEGLLTLRPEGVPSGVTAPEVIVSANESEATMVFTATAGATPGVSDINIYAEADSVTTSMRTLRLRIRPPGSFTLTGDPVSLVPGATASTTFNVNRIGGFTGTVTLTISAPPGLVAALQPAELTGNASTSLVTIAADRSLRPGAYFVRVTGSSPSFADETFDITVTVSGN